MVQKDHLKNKFNIAVGIKSEDTAAVVADQSSATTSFNSSLLRERKKENEIFASTALLNGKINQLNALASIHAANVQLEIAAGFRFTDQQKLRMRSTETQIDKLNNEIEQLNNKMENNIGKYTINPDSPLFKTPQAAIAAVAVGAVTGSFVDVDRTNGTAEENSEESVNLLESPQEEYINTPKVMIDTPNANASII